MEKRETPPQLLNFAAAASSFIDSAHSPNTPTPTLLPTYQFTNPFALNPIR
jgi:hypothetical protein